MPAVDDLGASKQIEDSVEHNPDAIDEMPVELSCFKAEMVAGADASTRAGLQSNDGDTNHPKSDVKAVKASEGVEGAGKKVVGEAEGQVEILNHLTHQENRTQAASDRQPEATGPQLSGPAFLASAVKGEAADDQNHRVDGG